MGVTFSPPEWQALLRARVGVPLEAAPRPCPHCHIEADVWGDHRLGCASCGLYRRHNKIHDYLVRKANEAGWSAVVEPQISADNGARADILMQGLAWAPLNSEAWDITVTHSLRQSASTAARVTPGVSATEAEKLKLGALEAHLCRAAGVGFRPFALETTGALGPKARAGLRRMAERLSLRSGEAQAVTFAGLCRDVMVLLAKGNGEMLTRAAPLGR